MYYFFLIYQFSTNVHLLLSQSVDISPKLFNRELTKQAFYVFPHTGYSIWIFDD